MLTNVLANSAPENILSSAWKVFGTQGATTINSQVIQPAASPSPQISRSFGSLLVQYVQQLVSTASAHTMVAQLSFPFLVVGDARESDSLVEGDVLLPEGVIAELQSLTGMPITRIAEDLFGVSRQAYYNWVAGSRLSFDKERQLRGTLEVLQRASVRYSNPDLLRGWLLTPVGSRAETPIELLRAGRIDEARLLSVSALPARNVAIPTWLQNAPLNEWSVRDRRRRDFVVRESDASTHEGNLID